MKDNRAGILLNNPSLARWASSPTRGEGNGMRGFTLIELLVVVLIIGILAAVAVPQYQKAVLKSRFVQLKTMAESIVKAEEVYYLANGTYTNQFEKLDLEIGGSDVAVGVNPSKQFDWGDCIIFFEPNTRAFVQCIDQKNYMGYSRNFYKGTYMCLDLTQNTNSIQHQLCVSETGARTYTAGYNGRDSYNGFTYVR